MLGGVVELQPPRYAPGLRRRKGLVQRRLAMGIEVVENHPDHRHIGVGLIHQPAHLMGEVPSGAPLRYRHMPAARQGLDEMEQVAGALAPVFEILPPRPPRFHRYRRPSAGQQLGGGLVDTDHRPLRVVGFGIKVQDFLHGRHEVGAHLGNAPLFLPPHLDGVFFKCSRTVSYDRESTTPNSTFRSANGRRFQWENRQRHQGDNQSDNQGDNQDERYRPGNVHHAMPALPEGQSGGMNSKAARAPIMPSLRISRLAGDRLLIMTWVLLVLLARRHALAGRKSYKPTALSATLSGGL